MEEQVLEDIMKSVDLLKIDNDMALDEIKTVKNNKIEYIISSVVAILIELVAMGLSALIFANFKMVVIMLLAIAYSGIDLSFTIDDKNSKIDELNKKIIKNNGLLQKCYEQVEKLFKESQELDKKTKVEKKNTITNAINKSYAVDTSNAVKIVDFKKYASRLKQGKRLH